MAIFGSGQVCAARATVVITRWQRRHVLGFEIKKLSLFGLRNGKKYLDTFGSKTEENGYLMTAPSLAQIMLLFISGYFADKCQARGYLTTSQVCDTLIVEVSWCKQC